MGLCALNEVKSLGILSEALRNVHFYTVEAEREFDPAARGLDLLDRLANDPGWAWLRSVSSLVGEIDHVLATDPGVTRAEVGTVAARARGLLFGEGELRDEAFLERYRPLLQQSHALAAAHGKLKLVLDHLPAEPEDQGDRRAARESWRRRTERTLAERRDRGRRVGDER
ncbi:MAG TPA: hypothetical protein VKZ85_17655 [Woeseiaceae bacterium]|nr:hypothetical protein [Woeseiaceae bacterium]